ncbi:MAG: REDY-like protein HapK [Dehalococcoidia bacterium]
MATLVVLFNLKSGADQAAYEQWAIQSDIPTVSALTSVDAFRVLKASGMLGGGDTPYQYIEVIEVNDLTTLRGELAGEAIRRIAEEFRTFADDPIFIMTNELALGESR